MSNIKISKNILLAPYTTFKIGGPAKYFFIAKSAEDLLEAIKWAKKTKVPVFILGNGSNILISDKGFDGLVIKVTSYGLPASQQGGQITGYEIIADAGALLSKLVDESVKAGLTGLEWAAGIPATVGGAVRGNAGAFGASMADAVKSVEVFNINSESRDQWSSGSAEFGYRDSIFKRDKDLMILSVTLELKQGNKEISKRVIKRHLAYRKKHQPLFPSAGCVFKNPVDKSAGHLIEQCGLNGKKIGGAQIFEKHGNFIVNIGRAKARDVKKLIDFCKEKVREKFEVNLKEEIEYLGEF